MKFIPNLNIEFMSRASFFGEPNLVGGYNLLQGGTQIS